MIRKMTWLKNSSSKNQLPPRSLPIITMTLWKFTKNQESTTSFQLFYWMLSIPMISQTYTSVLSQKFTWKQLIYISVREAIRKLLLITWKLDLCHSKTLEIKQLNFSFWFFKLRSIRLQLAMAWHSLITTKLKVLAHLI